MNKKTFDPVSKFHFRSSLEPQKLPLPVQQALNDRQSEISFKKNEVIYSEGSFPKGIYMIKTGMVKALHLNEDGSRQIIYFYVTGEIFGYRPLLCNEAHPVTTVALQPTVVDFIAADDFLAVLRESNELAQQLLFNLSKEFSMWVNRINVFAQRKVRQRLALALLILNEKFADGDNQMPIVITKTDLGNYIGTSIEVLVRTLKEFEDENWVVINGKQINIKNREKLYSVAGI